LSSLNGDDHTKDLDDSFTLPNLEKKQSLQRRATLVDIASIQKQAEQADEATLEKQIADLEKRYHGLKNKMKKMK